VDHAVQAPSWIALPARNGFPCFGDLSCQFLRILLTSIGVLRHLLSLLPYSLFPQPPSLLELPSQLSRKSMSSHIYPVVPDHLRLETVISRGGAMVTELYEPFEQLWKKHIETTEPNELTSFIKAQQDLFENRHEKPTMVNRERIAKACRGCLPERFLILCRQAFQQSAETRLDDVSVLGDWTYLRIVRPGEAHAEHRRLRTGSLPERTFTAEELRDHSMLIHDGTGLSPSHKIVDTVISPLQTYMAYSVFGSASEGDIHIRSLSSGKDVSTANGHPFASSIGEKCEFTWDHEEKGMFLIEDLGNGIRFAYRSLHDDTEIALPMASLSWIHGNSKAFFDLRCEAGYLMLTARQDYAAQRGGYNQHYLAQLWKAGASHEKIKQVGVQGALRCPDIATSMCLSFTFI
jgi:hypothetical protein